MVYLIRVVATNGKGDNLASVVTIVNSNSNLQVASHSCKLTQHMSSFEFRYLLYTYLASYVYAIYWFAIYSD